MIGQHEGFSRAVRAGTAGVDAYAPVDFTPGRWRTSSAKLLAAFAAASLDATAVNCELSSAPLPVVRLVRAQLLDTVVHTWDIAQALGRWYQPPAALVAVVAEAAASIPDDERRRDGGFPFGPALPARGPAWNTALAHLVAVRCTAGRHGRPTMPTSEAEAAPHSARSEGFEPPTF
jgi:uncharacterized protein (TIGR03086 family)